MIVNQVLLGLSLGIIAISNGDKRVSRVALAILFFALEIPATIRNCYRLYEMKRRGPNPLLDSLQPWQLAALCVPWIPMRAVAEVKQCLGRGMYGAVHLASIGGKEYALKVINGDNLSFSKDYERGKRLSPHPNIMEMYLMVEKGGKGGLFTEYVRGERLSDVDFSPFSQKELLAISRQFFQALEHIAKSGMGFSDLGGNNFLIRERQLKVVDLGALSRGEEYPCKEAIFFFATRLPGSIFRSELSGMQSVEEALALIDKNRLGA